MSDVAGLPFTGPPTALRGEMRDPQVVRAEARRVAEDFEGMVLSLLLAPMFESLDADGLGGGGAGERAFRPMLVEEYAKGVSKAGGIGVADAVMRELLRAQGLDPDAPVEGGSDGIDGRTGR